MSARSLILCVYYQLISPFKSRQLSKSYFSLHYQYNIKQTGHENKEKNQLSDTALIQHQILRTGVKRTVRLSVRRINVLNLELKWEKVDDLLNSLVSSNRIFLCSVCSVLIPNLPWVNGLKNKCRRLILGYYSTAMTTGRLWTFKKKRKERYNKQLINLERSVLTGKSQPFALLGQYGKVPV